VSCLANTQNSPIVVADGGDWVIVERRGGHPEHLLEDAPPDLSERANRKKAIANYLQKKYPLFDPQ
jgi:hypothetical protein